MNFIFTCIVLFALAFASIESARANPQPIGSVQIVRSSFLYNRQTDTFDSMVTLKNTGSVDLAAPVRLILESVTPLSVSLYNVYGETPTGKPYIDVPLQGFLLKAGGVISVPVRFVNLGKAVTNAKFSVEAERLTADATAQLSVAASMNAENGGQAVGPGFLVKLNNAARAVTDDEGKAAIRAPLDTTEVTVSIPPNYFGSAPVSALVAGESRTIGIEVSDNGEFGADSRMRLDRLQHLVLPANVPQLVIRFYKEERPVAADFISSVELRDPVGGTPTDITTVFSIRTDGGIAAASPSAFFAAMGALPGKKILFAQVLDKDGVTYEQILEFYIGQFTVQAKLSSPPSNPSVPLGGIPVDVAVLNTNIHFQTESLSDGSIPLPVLLPGGNVSLHATTSKGGVSYSGQGTAVINGNRKVELRMRGPTDISNNVPPITSSPL